MNVRILYLISDFDILDSDSPCVNADAIIDRGSRCADLRRSDLLDREDSRSAVEEDSTSARMCVYTTTGHRAGRPSDVLQRLSSYVYTFGFLSLPPRAADCLHAQIKAFERGTDAHLNALASKYLSVLFVGTAPAVRATASVACAI
jgi:hypothetical protein